MSYMQRVATFLLDVTNTGASGQSVGLSICGNQGVAIFLCSRVTLIIDDEQQIEQLRRYHVVKI
jgi:hypothetical protein